MTEIVDTMRLIRLRVWSFVIRRVNLETMRVVTNEIFKKREVEKTDGQE